MLILLSRIFIKDYQNYEKASVRRMYGILSGALGIFLNALLFGFKYFAGIISGSVAITADAFNNLSDAGSSLITLVGFKAAGMKPDKEHPFGHGRIEYVAGLIVSMAIILMGIELGRSSISKILNPVDINTGLISFVIMFCSVAVKGYMAFYNSFYGKKINSSTMRATAIDSMSDVIATTVVIISMVVSMLFDVNVDGYCGVLVAGFIIFSGISAASDTLSPLLGVKPEPEFVQKIYDIVSVYDKVEGIHDLIVHDYGYGRRIISLHVEVPGDENIFELHDMIENIEAELDRNLECESVIHLDPVESKNELVKEMRRSVSDMVKQINDELSIHDFRMMTCNAHVNLIFDLVVPVEFSEKDTQRVKRQIEENIQQRYPDYLAVIKIEKSYI